VHVISITPLFSNHLGLVTIFEWSFGRSHKTGLTEGSVNVYIDHRGWGGEPNEPVMFAETSCCNGRVKNIDFIHIVSDENEI
jgi:hypothetical protein